MNKAAQLFHQPVPGADVSLFARMTRDYISEEEKVFFERLSYDEANVTI